MRALIGACTIAVLTGRAHAQGAPKTATSQISILNGYIDRARALGDQGHADSALMVLSSLAKDHPEIPVATIDRRIATDRIRYQLVGGRAPAIEAPTWMNLPAGMKHLDPTGKVTLIEFTAHWCAPCWKSYSMLNELAKTFGEQLQRVLVTELYGTFEGKPASPVAESAGDRKYFAEKMTGKYIVAISDKPPPPVVPGTYGTVNTDRYGVEPLPQIVIVDRHGVVRRIIVGPSEASWKQLSGLVAALLKEK